MFDHIYAWYGEMEDIYSASAEYLDLPYAHIAEYCVDRWWALYSETNVIETITIVEYA